MEPFQAAPQRVTLGVGNTIVYLHLVPDSIGQLPKPNIVDTTNVAADVFT